MIERSSLSSFLVLLRRIGVGVLTAYVTTSLILGGTSSAEPVFHGLAASWCAVCALAWFRPPAFARSAGARWVELIVTNVAFSLLLAEVCLQTLGAWWGHSLLTEHTLAAHRLKPGHDYGNGLRGNRHGYPGAELPTQKPAGVYRIAALGDSFAVGPAVPFADNYLTLLQKPGVEVCNFGVSGAGPREYHAILQRDVWTVEPDLVLVSIFVGNDITESLPSPRHLDPRGHAVYLLCTRGWRLVHEWQTRADAPSTLAPATFREIESRRLNVCLPSASSALQKKWLRAEKYLERIIHECQQRRVAVAFVLIPDEFQVNPAVLNQALSDANLSADAIDLDLPQRRLRSFCERHRIPCLDLLPAFQGRTNTYAANDTHWNVNGNRLAAVTISEWLGRVCHTGARHGLFVSPNGAKYDSPGQRPGKSHCPMSN